MPQLDFRLLGPLEAFADGTPLPVAAGKQRALLALLLLNANRTVARDQIVDGLWGEDVPESAPKMVQILVSQLRKALPESRLATRAPGYTLALRDNELDLVRFERLLADARRVLNDDPARASDLLAEGLALWRGAALTEFSEPFARHESARLEELRLSATETRIEAELARAHHREVVAELETLIAQHPLRESLRSQHMLTLYGAGRQADALASYTAFRRRLSDELGIEPSPPLRELERRMLRHEISLDAQPVPETTRVSFEPAPLPGLDDVAYARSGDVRIAYQVVGDGPLDLVLVHGWICTFQPGWEHPKIASFYRRLASMGRLILFDKRGTGLSDRVSPEHLPDLETRIDDVRAVLDSVGSERAALLGISEGGPMSTLFSATYPERTVSLVLIGSYAREMWAPDYPSGVREESLRQRLALLEQDDWAAAATRDWLGRVAPEIVHDAEAMKWYVSYVRRGASPAAARALRLMNAEIDVRDLLPTIAVPTLVLHRERETWSDGSRYLSEHIRDAQTVELPGDDHLPWEGDREALLDEIERFLAGVGDAVEPDRVLATLLVADVDGADEEPVRQQVVRFRGTVADAAGDALVATFDGPARAVRCAAAIVISAGTGGRRAKAGVHTGEVDRGSTTVRGPAFELAAAIAAAARPGEVLVSSTLRDIVAGSGIAFEERRQDGLDARVFAAVAPTPATALQQ